MAEGGKCPFGHDRKTAGGGTTNKDWWPNQLKLNILRQHSIAGLIISISIRPEGFCGL